MGIGRNSENSNRKIGSSKSAFYAATDLNNKDEITRNNRRTTEIRVRERRVEVDEEDVESMDFEPITDSQQTLQSQQLY